MNIFDPREQVFHQVPGGGGLGGGALPALRDPGGADHRSGDGEDRHSDGSGLRSGPRRQLLLHRSGQCGLS